MSSPEPGGRPPALAWNLILLTGFLIMVPWILFVGAPAAWRLSGRFVGFLLRKKTEGRRSVLVSAMDEENEKSPQAQEHAESKSSSSSDEWEKVSGGADDAVADKLKDKTQDWDGIIGFFHPFW